MTKYYNFLYLYFRKSLLTLMIVVSYGASASCDLIQKSISDTDKDLNGMSLSDLQHELEGAPTQRVPRPHFRPAVTTTEEFGVLSEERDLVGFDVLGKGHEKGVVVHGKTQEGGSFAARTDIGDVPQKYKNAAGEPVNQDALVAFRTPDGRTVFISLDGVGGHGGGEVASGWVAEHLANSAKDGKSIEEAVKEAPSGFAKAIRAEHAGTPTNAGTVLVSLELKGDVATFTNVGDTRAVVFRGNDIQFRTHEQSPYGALFDVHIEKRLAELKEAGIQGKAAETQAIKELENSDYFDSPGKNSIWGGVFAENYKKGYKVEPVKSSVKLEKGDWSVLASDGMWDNMRMHEVNQILQTSPTPEEATARLRAFVKDKVLTKGGKPDNISIIVYRH